MAANPEVVMTKVIEGLAGSLAQLRYLRSLKEEVVIKKEELPKFDEAIAKLFELIQFISNLEVKTK